jgi:hypothetical protein
MKPEEIVKNFLREQASKGGSNTLKKYGTEHYKKMALKGWKNRKKRTGDK